MQNFDVKLPKWMQALPENSPIIKRIISDVKESSKSIEKMRDYLAVTSLYSSDCNRNTRR